MSDLDILEKDANLIDINSSDIPDEPEELDAAPAEEEQEQDPRDAIYAKYDAARSEEAGIKPELVTEEQAEPEEKPDAEVMIKVNGRERPVLQSKIDAAGGVDAYQKNAAASEILNQAREKERQVEAQVARLQEIERDLIRQQEDLKQKAVPPDEGAQKKLAEQYHEALLGGDMDQAGELLLQIQAAQKATPVDTAAIANQAVQRARQELDAERKREAVARYNAERDQAVKQFFDEEKDIVKDPELVNMVDAKTVAIMDEHPEWGPAQVMKEAATRVRNWASQRFPVDKLAAKRSQDVVKGGSARATPRPAPKPQTASDYVTSLRRERGLE